MHMDYLHYFICLHVHLLAFRQMGNPKSIFYLVTLISFETKQMMSIRDFNHDLLQKQSGQECKLNTCDQEQAFINRWVRDYFGKPLSSTRIKSYIHKHHLKLYCTKRSLCKGMAEGAETTPYCCTP